MTETSTQGINSKKQRAKTPESIRKLNLAYRQLVTDPTNLRRLDHFTSQLSSFVTTEAIKKLIDLPIKQEKDYA